MMTAKLNGHMVELCGFVDDVAIILKETRASLLVIDEIARIMNGAMAMRFNYEKTYILPLTYLSCIYLQDCPNLLYTVALRARYLGHDYWTIC